MGLPKQYEDEFRSAVYMLGLFVLVKSFDGFFYLVEFEKYSAVFRHLPDENTLKLRFFFSWAFRVGLFTTGIGIMFRRQFFRRAAIVLCSGAVLCTPWKHPYQAVYNANLRFGVDLETVIPRLKQLGFPATTPEQFIFWIMILIWVMDIFVFGAIIYVLTRKTISSQFK